MKIWLKVYDRICVFMLTYAHFEKLKVSNRKQIQNKTLAISSLGVKGENMKSPNVVIVLLKGLEQNREMEELEMGVDPGKGFCQDGKI